MKFVNSGLEWRSDFVIITNFRYLKLSETPNAQYINIQKQ